MMANVRKATGREKWVVFKTDPLKIKTTQSGYRRSVVTRTFEFLHFELECGHWLRGDFLSKRKDGRHECMDCIETPNVQIEGQPAVGLSRSNAGLGADNGDENDKSTR